MHALWSGVGGWRGQDAAAPVGAFRFSIRYLLGVFGVQILIATLRGWADNSANFMLCRALFSSQVKADLDAIGLTVV